MMGVGRFSNKNMIDGAGFRPRPDDDAGIYFDGDTAYCTRPLKVEGDMTFTGITANAGTVASLGTNALKVGSSAGNDSVTAMWRTIYTWNMGALPGIVGSTNAVITVDVAASGAAIGDFVMVSPIGSLTQHVHVQGFCFSAANVNLRAWYTGSTGAYTPGEVPLKIGILKW